MTKQTRVLSGVQPTGNLHLGNYLGAIKNWVALQDSHECLFMLADLHAITVQQDPDHLRNSVLETAAAYIACGVDTTKSTIFQQSRVSGHSELAWILNCHTPTGWLNRMTQFKDKSGSDRDNALLGLYAYPVLMAADILTYQATHVPVGEDQTQHLQLTRDIAGAFNRAYNTEFFTIPEAIVMPTGARIMSLRDGTKKMSKSDPSDYSRINLTDNADTIAKKIRKATSDSISGVTYDKANRPEVSNLLTIFAALQDTTPEKVAEMYASAETSKFKNDLADLTVAKLAPISTKINELLQDTTHLNFIVRIGAADAKDIAQPTIFNIKHLVGLL